MKKALFIFCVLTVFSWKAMAFSGEHPDPKNLPVTKGMLKNVTPLSVAIYRNDINTIKKMIEFGVDIEKASQRVGMTALMYAARQNKLEVVKLLVENGANPNKKSKLKLKAIDYADMAHASAVVDYLKSIE